MDCVKQNLTKFCSVAQVSLKFAIPLSQPSSAGILGMQPPFLAWTYTPTSRSCLTLDFRQCCPSTSTRHNHVSSMTPHMVPSSKKSPMSSKKGPILGYSL